MQVDYFIAGTLITGVIQSSTAMAVMVVGLVNSGGWGFVRRSALTGDAQRPRWG